MQSSDLKAGFKLGNWLIEPRLNRISLAEHEAISETISEANTDSTVTPKVMSLCVLLAEKAGQPVSQGEIAQYVWPGVIISDSSIYQAIAQLRKALGDTEPQKKYIERVSGKGYRLIVTVALLNDEYENEYREGNAKSVVDDSAVKITQQAQHAAKLSATETGKSEISAMAGNRIGSYIIAFSTLVIFSLLVLGIKNSGKPSDPSSTYQSHAFQIKTLAILPTENLTEPRKAELDSLSRLILSDLLSISQIDLILVRDQSLDFEADARLSHSISSSNEGLILSAQLIHSFNHKVIWAEEFQARKGELLELKRQFTNALVMQLSDNKVNPKTRMQGSAQKSVLSRQQSDLSQQQYESFILAEYLWNKRESEDLLTAKTLFEDILQQQPDNAETLVGLCNTYLFLHIYSDWTKQQAYSQCAQLMNKAASLSPDNGKVLATQGLLKSDGEPEKAIDLFKQAIKQTPNYADAYLWYGNLLRTMGAVEQALEVHQKALSLDPLSPSINRSLAYSYLNLRNLELARQYYQRALAIKPEYSLRPVEELDFLSLNTGRAKQFIQWSDNNKTNLGKRAPYQLTQALVRLGLGQIAKAEVLINQVQVGQVNKAFLLYTRAALHAAKGEFQQSLKLLETRFDDSVANEQNSARHVMPYLALLMHIGSYEHALNLFRQYFSEISAKKQMTPLNSGQFIFFYALLKANNVQLQSQTIEAKIKTYFQDISEPQISLTYIHWLLHQNKSDKARIAIETLFNQQWLPDYNDNILAELNLEKAYLQAGGEQERFDAMLQHNRKMN